MELCLIRILVAQDYKHMSAFNCQQAGHATILQNIHDTNTTLWTYDIDLTVYQLIAEQQQLCRAIAAIEQHPL